MKLLNRISRKATTEKYIISRSIIVISASMLSNVFAYLFQIISGRYLSVSDYSVLVSLFSLSGILLMPITFFTGGITKLVAEIKDQDYPNKISALFISLAKFHFIFATLLTLILFLGNKQLGAYLKINNQELLKVFAIAVFAGNLMGFIPPFMQGLMRFKAYSFTTFMTSFTKFLTAITVMYFAMNVIDIFWGLFGTTIFVGLTGFFLLRKNLKIKSYPFDTKDFITLTKYSLLSALGIATVVLMQNIDVVVVKHHFDEISAGIYGSVTIIGRIIFYAASPVAIVMLPICSERFIKKQDFLKPFGVSLGLSGIIAFMIFALYFLFPHTFISVLFGQKYIAAAPYLGLYGFYMFLYTILNLFIVFYISISKFKYASIGIIAPIIEYIGLQYFNKNLYQIIWVNILSTVITILILIFLFYKVYTSPKNED